VSPPSVERGDGARARIAELVAAARGDRESAATVELAGFGPAAVEAVIQALLSEPAPGGRRQLVGLLEELAPPHLDRLEAAMDEAPWFLVRNLVAVVGRVGAVEQLPVLEGLLAHDHPAVRREAVRGVVRLGGVLAVASLVQAGADPDPGVRRLALRALAEVDSAASVAALARASRPGRPAGERQVALSGLARSARPEAEAALRRAAGRLAVSAASRRVRAHARVLLAQRPRRMVTFR